MAMRRDSLRLGEMEHELIAAGYLLERMKGSHRHYRHQETRQRLTLAYHHGHGLDWRRVDAIRREMRRAQQQQR